MEAARVGPAEASSTRAWACAAAAAEAAVVDCRPRTGYPARARVSGACFRQRAKTVAPLLLFVVLMIWMLLDLLVVARVRGAGAFCVSLWGHRPPRHVYQLILPLFRNN